jgi:hypothetical protein
MLFRGLYSTNSVGVLTPVTTVYNALGCTSAKVHRHFGKMYCLHVLGRKIQQETKPEISRRYAKRGSGFLRNFGRLLHIATWHYVPDRTRVVLPLKIIFSLWPYGGIYTSKVMLESFRVLMEKLDVFITGGILIKSWGRWKCCITASSIYSLWLCVILYYYIARTA